MYKLKKKFSNAILCEEKLKFTLRTLAFHVSILSQQFGGWVFCFVLDGWMKLFEYVLFYRFFEEMLNTLIHTHAVFNAYQQIDTFNVKYT